MLIINEGAIPHMLAGAKGGDMITKQSCGAVLSALSSKVGTLLILGGKNRGVLPPPLYTHGKLQVSEDARRRILINRTWGGGGHLVL